MGWQTDQEPLNYLKRRVIYYKKQLNTVKKWEEKKFLANKYSKEQIKQIAANRILYIDAMINEFQSAIDTLSFHGY